MGALSGKDVHTIATYNVIIGVGFILIGLASGTETGFAGAIYYLIHDMLAKALLFLLVGTMVYLTGETSREKYEWSYSKLSAIWLDLFSCHVCTCWYSATQWVYWKGINWTRCD